jgi:hypothetical protein
MSRRSRILHFTTTLAAMGTLLTACADSDADAGDLKAALPSPQAASSTPSKAALPDGVLPLPGPDANDETVITEAGRYRIPLSDTLSLDVDLPSRTGVNGDGLYLQFEDTILKVESAGDDYGVPTDPCHGFTTIEPAGAGVDGLVAAISNQPIYLTRLPRPVEIGGAAGQYVKVQIPRGYDASSCTDSQVGLPGNPGSNNNMEPGYVGQWWILDVAGQRTVLQAFCAQCDDPTSKRMARMIKNITFTPTT